MDAVEFSCNICGCENRVIRSTLDRESSSCRKCQSSVRTRAIAFLIVKEITGAGGLLRNLRPSGHVVIGLSDWSGYASHLESRLRYQNTFYTREPRLDITDPPARLHGRADLVIASDVFEHVAPPVSAAFHGAAQLLKPGGALVFSVPYGLHGDTAEHFPNLHDYSVEGEGAERRLVNRTRDGQVETFDGLCFHGGEGATLEMRVFSLASLVAQCRSAGLQEPEIMQDVPAHGILWPHSWSHAMLIRKPR